MQVIARDLGCKIDKKDAFKGDDGKYYSCEDGYKATLLRKQLKVADEHQKEMRVKCIDKMFEFMRYNTSARMPSLFFGRLKIWNDKWGYNYDIIYESMCLSEKAVQKTWLTKEFDTDTSRMFYFMGIIQNALNDGKREFERKQKLIEESHNTEVAVEIDTNVGVGNRKGKIINLFGGDDSWT